MKQFYPTLLALLAATPLAAQSLTNDGGIISVQSGAVLYVPGPLSNRASSTFSNAGTVQVLGDLTNAGTVTSPGLVLLSGSAAQTLTPGGATLGQLEVNNSSTQGVSVPADLIISGQLKLTNGMVRTAASSTISLTSAASVTGEATGRYVQGNLRVTRSSVTSATDFTNSITLGGNGQNLGQVTVTRVAGLTTSGTSYGTFSNNKSIDRIWTVVAAQAPTAAVPITLSWLPDNDNGLTDFSRVLIWRQASAGAPWNGVGSSADASATRSISSTTTVLDRLTISNQANPLPVQLVRFTAERRADDAWLRWTTASELNNARFELEVSLDGRQFRKIGEAAGRGTTSQRTDYEFTDARIARYGAPLLYYRLRQLDADGTATTSPVQVVAVEATAQLTVQAQPNPFGQELFVRVTAPQAGAAALTLHDALGRVLITKQLDLPASTSEWALPEATKLPLGVYFITIRQAKTTRVVKVVRE